MSAGVPGAPGAPLWKEIVHLIRSMPKPPVHARVVARGPEETREAAVFFDGIDVWFIDNGERIQISAPGSTMFWEDGKLENIRAMGAAADNWVKAHIVGSFAYIRESDGSVVGEDELLGRPCWIVEVPGLRRSEPEMVSRMWIDKDHGWVLRNLRTDMPEFTSEIAELTIGVVRRPFVSAGDQEG